MSETATLEAPAVDPKPVEQPQPYVMPVPHDDAVVRWYANGDRNNRPVAAYVLAVFPATNMIRIFVPSDQLAPVKTPLHISDPRVKDQPRSVQTEARGTWDFSAEHYRRQEWEAKIEASFKEMNETVATLMAEWNYPGKNKKA